MIGIARPYNNHYFLSIRCDIENDVFSKKKLKIKMKIILKTSKDFQKIGKMSGPL